MIHRQSGFTLVEMLVAISVSALLVSLVYGAVRLGQRSTSAMEDRLDQSEVMRIGWRFLHDAVRRARAHPDDQDDEDLSGFVGSTNALTFVADMPPYNGLGGLMRISLESEETATGSQLVISRRPVFAHPELVDDEDAQRAVLVDRLDELAIQYYGVAASDEPAAWHTEWEAMPTLPSLVSIRVTPNGAAAWPVLTAGLWNAAATYDPDGEPAADEEEELPNESPRGADALTRAL